MRYPWRTLLRCVGAVLFIGLYLGLTAFFQLAELDGDTLDTPFAYFWTWDMFPNHDCFSVRSTAIGRTASGRFVTIFPGPKQRFRWGAGSELTRTERRPESGERLIQSILAERKDADAADPIVHAYLLEKYWPVRFNTPEPLYEQLLGQPRPRRRYWRVVREFDVSDSRLLTPGARS